MAKKAKDTPVMSKETEKAIVENAELLPGSAMVKDLSSGDVTYEDAVRDMMEHYKEMCTAVGSKISMRELQWDLFAAIVAQHVVEYTVPQYGDYPTDQVTKYTVHDCNVNILRYANRLETSSRDEDNTLMDYLKIANYACFAYLKTLNLEEKFVLPEEDTSAPLAPEA